MTARGEIAAIFTSSLLAPLLLSVVEEDAVRLLLMATAATLACVAVSLAFGPEKETTLRAFYERARPFGLWEPFRSPEEHVRQSTAFRTALVGLLFCAVSVFSLLVGVGSLMMGSPGPTWFPSRGLWVFVMLALGIGAMPGWWLAHRSHRLRNHEPGDVNPD